MTADSVPSQSPNPPDLHYWEPDFDWSGDNEQTEPCIQCHRTHAEHVADLDEWRDTAAWVLFEHTFQAAEEQAGQSDEEMLYDHLHAAIEHLTVAGFDPCTPRPISGDTEHGSSNG